LVRNGSNDRIINFVPENCFVFATSRRWWII
jgi:hypothetical protein